MEEITLRDYQQQAVQKIQSSFLQGHKKVLFTLPTGGGKTVLFNHMARRAAAKGKRVLILAQKMSIP